MSIGIPRPGLRLTVVGPVWESRRLEGGVQAGVALRLSGEADPRHHTGRAEKVSR